MTPLPATNLHNSASNGCDTRSSHMANNNRPTCPNNFRQTCYH